MNTSDSQSPALVAVPPLATGSVSSGAELIAEERKRQILGEGYNASHDDYHDRGELSAAGASYAMAASAQVKFRRDTMADITPPSQWPWEQEWWKLSDDPVRTLTKAGALIAAEIDRLQRARNTEVTQ
jgi:hypothetical protein